ncbi:MAG: cyclic nucleotide-binding domain-containing protein [Rhodobacteraceae bacterium]|nr:cyclic nucleotide-binding domain-containing protein [Paracoccaceae bacterium]
MGVLMLGLSVAVFVYAAFVFDVFGFLARDELWLRLQMMAAMMLYIIYYYLVADAPLWDAIITNGTLAAVNLAMIFVVIAERTTFSMTSETAQLYKKFTMLSPGQFRRLLRLGARATTIDPKVLVTEGAPIDTVYFVINNTARLEKNDEVFPLESGSFVGEIGFLTDQPASATVSVDAGTEYFAWDVAELHRVFARSTGLRNALLAQLNKDLANKLSRSVPIRTGIQTA